jgi:hypothetical protein
MGSISAILELSCTRSKMISGPSGETSKSPITKLDGRSVSWRSAPVCGSNRQKSLWPIPPRRMNERPLVRRERNPTRATGQRHARPSVGSTVRIESLQRKCGAHVRARIDQVHSVRRPDRIDRILGRHWLRRSAIEEYPREAGFAVAYDPSDEGLRVGRPRQIAAHGERGADRSQVPAVAAGSCGQCPAWLRSHLRSVSG